MCQRNAKKIIRTLSKQTKIAKDFLITDSTVNSYGFRLLTEGYLMAEYKKNPIGYGMHKREEGVLVRWEDLRAEGDKVFGKPVINLNHPNGQRTVDEIENGFLNAASVGHIVVLEVSDDPALKLPNQTGPTVTKWYNRECSLVDVPGNYNALTKLFDADDNPINLSDFTKPNLTMKQFAFTLANLLALGLAAETASEADVQKSFKDLVDKAGKADALKAELDALKTNSIATQIKGLVDSALSAKKINQALADKLKADYAQNPDALKALIDVMPEYSSLSSQLGGAGAGATGKEKRIADLSAKSVNDLMASGESEELQKLAPDVWKQKVKEMQEAE